MISNFEYSQNNIKFMTDMLNLRLNMFNEHRRNCIVSLRYVSEIFSFRINQMLCWFIVCKYVQENYNIHQLMALITKKIYFRVLKWYDYQELRASRLNIFLSIESGRLGRVVSRAQESENQRYHFLRLRITLFSNGVLILITNISEKIV